MKYLSISWLMAGMVAVAGTAHAQTCPPSIALANNATTSDGMKSNDGLLMYNLGTSAVTGSGRTCTYTRANTANFDPFIGRNLVAGESSATSTGNNTWQVAIAGGGVKTVTCPANIEIGPVAMYAAAGGMTPVPGSWSITQNNVQSLSFDTKSNQAPFALRCNYHGVSNVVVYVTPPTRNFSAATCAGLYAASGSLSARLAACPGLDDLLVWEDGQGNLTSHSGYTYPAWTAGQRARLDQLFQLMESGQASLGLDCPNPSANLWTPGQTNAGPNNPVHSQLATQLFFTANQAFDTYAAQVAWSFHLEVHHLVPWSLVSHPASELVEFFDARRHHTRFPARSAVYASGYANPAAYPTPIQEGRDYWNATSRISAAWEAVCDPRVAYQFLSGGPYSSSHASLLGATELATLKNLTWWFYNSVGHGAMQDSQTTQILNTPSVFLSNRLMARSDTFYTPPSQPLVIADAGCHSAANLFYDLAKGVNIPVLHVASDQPGPPIGYPRPPVYIDYGRHSGLVYGWGSPATTLILQHADDMYADYGLIFPVNAANLPVTDPADTFFTATWLPPAQLTPWNYTLTSDFGLQTPFSKYGNTDEREVESNGILAGYWTPGGALPFANSSRFQWFNSGQLCSYGGSANVMPGCSNPASNLQTNWQNSFGQTVLQAPGGGTSTTPQGYINHLQICAVAATGIAAPAAACGAFSGTGSVYFMQQQNRHATTFWVGPGGI